MKKIFSLIAAVLFAGSMFAEETVYKQTIFNATNNSEGVSSYTATWTNTTDGFTVTITNANNNNNVWEYIKMGRKNNASVGTIVTPAINKAVTKVAVTIDALTASKINSVKLYLSTDGSAWTEEGSFAKETGVKEVEVATANQAANLYYKLEFDCASGSSNGLITVSKLEFYAEGGDEQIDATAVELNKTELELQEGESETLVATLTPTNATTTVTWESDDEAVATVNAAGKVTAISAGTATITAKAGEVSATCAVTVTAAPLMTCAEAAALAKDEIAKLNEFVVTFVQGSNIYIKDESGYELIYKSSFGLVAGDVVNGFIGKSSPYNGLPELIPTVALADLVIEHGEAPAPEEITAAPTNADINKYLIIKDVKVSATAFPSNKNLTATIGEETFTLRNNFNLSPTFDTEKSYDIIGAGAIYNTTLQLYFISATEHIATAIDNTNATEKAVKVFENGQLVIIKNGVRYNALGVQL